MTNEEVMQLFTEFGAHKGGLENWVNDNIYVSIINRAIADEREVNANLCEKLGAEGFGTLYISAAIRDRNEK